MCLFYYFIFLLIYLYDIALKKPLLQSDSLRKYLYIRECQIINKFMKWKVSLHL